MKKLMILLSFVMVLVGCSAVEDVVNGANYIKEGADYIGDVQQFSSGLPKAIETAKQTNSPDGVIALSEEMISDITEFNDLTPPNTLKNLHDELKTRNERFKEKLETFNANVSKENIEASVDELKKGLDQEINKITSIYEQIKAFNLN